MQQSSPVHENVHIGILALQGAFAEHQVMLQKLSLKRRVIIVLVRQPEDLDRCDALIIPGGESTTIALLARLAGLLEPMREFLKTKPVWGTCAGAILLARWIEGAKKGGQELLGGIAITIERNGFGSQVESFEAPLEVDALREANRPFHGIFIRAPVVIALNPSPTDPPIQIISRISTSLLPASQTTVPPDEDDTDPRDPRTIVALRQGLHLLTTFHPELTKDDRFHEYFVRECVLPTLSSRKTAAPKLVSLEDGSISSAASSVPGHILASACVYNNNDGTPTCRCSRADCACHCGRTPARASTPTTSAEPERVPMRSQTEMSVRLTVELREAQAQIWNLELQEEAVRAESSRDA